MASFIIYGESPKFNAFSKGRRITEDLIHEALVSFGSLVADQLARDRASGFPLWDSCSMIEQSWEAFSSKASVKAWISWTFEKLEYKK